MAMIDVIRADGTSRLTTCADDECDGIVLDLSQQPLAPLLLDHVRQTAMPSLPIAPAAAD